MNGLVIRSTGSFATVRTDEGQNLECRVRGLFRIKGIRSTNPIAVGDRVVLELEETHTTIVDILPRENYLIRKSINLSKESHILAANIQQAFIVATLHSPRTSTGFIDRLLLTCEAYQIPVMVLLNKIDLCDNPKDQAKVEELHAIYSPGEYEILHVSALTGEGIDTLKDRMRGKINLMSGHSGSGKSSLINKVNPSLDLRTGDISKAHAKGQHTTTFAELFELFPGTWMIDTPGVKEFGMVDMEKSEIRDYFPEIRLLSTQCKFNNCMHVNEPGCAVREMADSEMLHEQRYISYLGMLASDELKKNW